MKAQYIIRSFSEASLKIIRTAEEICNDYAQQGYELTLRQLYYQFVSRDIIPNKDSEYDKLGATINAARLAGMLDWSHIEDRTRNLQEWQHYDSPERAIEQAAEGYFIDLWEGQEHYVEVWVEKEALAGVIRQAAMKRDVPYFSCRGYVSQSEMHAAGERLQEQVDMGRRPVVIHLGDHDPSGIDMTRDIEARLRMFMAGEIEVDEDGRCEDQEFNCECVDLTVDRIALNMPQVRQYNPPPNPAKVSDSRARSYIDRFGTSSWELDALNPATLEALIIKTIDGYLDLDQFNERLQQQKDERTAIAELVKNIRGGDDE